MCIIKVCVWPSDCLSSRPLSNHLRVYHQGLCLTIWVCIIKVFVLSSECVSSWSLFNHLSAYHQGLWPSVCIIKVSVQVSGCVSSRSVSINLRVYHQVLCVTISVYHQGLSWGPPGKLKKWSPFINSCCCYVAEILPIWYKTLYNKSINQGLCLTIWVCIFNVFVLPAECVSSKSLSNHLRVYHQGFCLII